MKHAQFLFCLGVAMICAAPALAKPAYVASTVNLRAAPGTTSEIVTKIPGGSLVDAGECSEGWCEVTWQEKKGFAIQTSLDTSGRIPQRASAARPPASGRSAGPAYAGPGPAYGPDERYVEVDEPAYYYGPPRAYYYGGPYYRPYWGWRRHW